MNAKKLLMVFWAGITTFALLVTSPAFAQDEADGSTMALSEEATESVSDAVESEENARADESREQIVQEAVSALEETRNALTALDEGRADDALTAMAVATGQLELLLAREPDLALAPTHVSVATRDVYGTKAAIENAIEEAEELLGDGMVQAARRLLEGIASETVITVTNIPVATYPDAIKAIAPLIDEGKLEEARHGLQAALNTLVLTDHVIPLPVVRAESLLQQAEVLSEKDDRSAEESDELSKLLVAARGELEMAELLGYGRSGDYGGLYARIQEIESQTRDGKSGRGFFSRIRQSLSNLGATTSADS